MTQIHFPSDIASLIDRIRGLAIADGIVAYAVGGSVRDALLARPMHDLDIAVDRDALAFGCRLADALGGHFVELDDVNAIARVVLDDGPVRHIDVAQLRGSIEDDLRRRDFTVNALAVRLGELDVLDATGGLDDLNRRLVRMTSPTAFADDPLRLLRCARIASELAFAIDPATEAAVRASAITLRASAAERQRDELARVFALDDAYGGVRLLDRLGLLDVLLPELTAGRGVTQPGAFHAFDVFEHNLRALEIMDVMLAKERPLRPNAWLWDAVWREFGWREETLRAYFAEEMSEGRSRAALLKLATLLHDVAKPQTRTVGDDGSAHFYGHSDAGGTIASSIMRRLRFSSHEARFVTTLVTQHLRPVQLSAVGRVPAGSFMRGLHRLADATLPGGLMRFIAARLGVRLGPMQMAAPPSRRALYRFYNALGDAMPSVLMLALADAASARGLIGEADSAASERWARHVRYMNSLLVRSIEEEGILDPPRLLTGDDIMHHLSIDQGPLVGTLLEAVREAQAAGEVHNADEALALAKRLVHAESHEGGGGE